MNIKFICIQLTRSAQCPPNSDHSMQLARLVLESAMPFRIYAFRSRPATIWAHLSIHRIPISASARRLAPWFHVRRGISLFLRHCGSMFSRAVDKSSFGLLRASINPISGSVTHQTESYCYSACSLRNCCWIDSMRSDCCWIACFVQSLVDCSTGSFRLVFVGEGENRRRNRRRRHRISRKIDVKLSWHSAAVVLAASGCGKLLWLFLAFGKSWPQPAIFVRTLLWTENENQKIVYARVVHRMMQSDEMQRLCCDMKTWANNSDSKSVLRGNFFISWFHCSITYLISVLRINCRGKNWIFVGRRTYSGCAWTIVTCELWNAWFTDTWFRCIQLGALVLHTKWTVRIFIVEKLLYSNSSLWFVSISLLSILGKKISIAFPQGLF